MYFRRSYLNSIIILLCLFYLQFASNKVSITNYSIPILNRLTNIAGSSEQHAGTLQMSRHVRLVRAQDLLEGHTGLSDGRQDPEGTFPERCAGDAEQSGQRDAVDQNSRIASEAARPAKAEEAS